MVLLGFFFNILYFFITFVYINGILPAVSHYKWFVDSTSRSVALVRVICSRAAHLCLSCPLAQVQSLAL
jgi:hypothetical protein